MGLGNIKIERIRTKLKNAPPYDWEDDVEALLEALEEMRALAAQRLTDFNSELEGGRELRKHLGALRNEALWSAAERVRRENDILKDALMRVAAAHDLEKVQQVVRAAQVKIWGEE
jgi:hypothetical protein